MAPIVPILGLLQDAGIVNHGFAEGWGMVVVLFFGLPAFVLSPVALTLSVLPRPWDPALLVLNGLLLLVVAAMFFDFRDVATGVILLSAYLLGSLALGLRCLVSKWELRRT